MSQLYIVYHLYQTARWEQLFAEQIGLIYSSGLLANARLILSVNGTEKVPCLGNCTIVQREDGFAEKPSLLLARSIADQDGNARILYMHSKGISHPTRNQDDWRMMMQHFLIVNWRLAVSYLDNHDLATVNWRTYPVPHPSGNYWWANASYLRKLSLEYLDDPSRMHHEFWTGTIPCKVANMHETELNHYTMECPSSKYSNDYFDLYEREQFKLGFPSRAQAIQEGRLFPVHDVDYF